MAITIFMAAILIISFVLMFGLVNFSEKVIAAPEAAPAGDGTAGPSGVQNAP